MIQRLIRGAIHRSLYRTRLGAVILDCVPRRTRFYDNSVHKVPYRVHRIFELWRNEVPTLAKESKLVFDAYQGGDFVDIGAFNGWYSLLFAPKAKPGDSFVSVEPDSTCASALSTTLQTLERIYPLVSFKLIDRAIGDGSAVDVVTPQGKAGHPSFRSTSGNRSNVSQSSLTLDELVTTNDLRPSFIKVDVEGAEYEVLLGAKKTLREFHPVLMTELHPDWLSKGITVDIIVQYLQSFGYSSTPIDDVHLIWK
jgi:FkbM family methyltransferase